MADRKPGCHGTNQIVCRPDPQPTHGQDCTHSDDHRCTSAPTTTTATPTTTTTRNAPVAPPATGHGGIPTVGVQTPPPGQLAYTGANSVALGFEAGVGLFLVLIGTAIVRKCRR